MTWNRCKSCSGRSGDWLINNSKIKHLAF
jgi:hypothetical protein